MKIFFSRLKRKIRHTKNIISVHKNAVQADFFKLISLPHKLYAVKGLKAEYEIIKKINSGKDGDIYLCKHKINQESFIVKVLSPYALSYLPLTKKFIEKDIFSPFVYKPTLIEDKYLIYPYEKLFEISTDPKNFLKAVSQICKLESALLAQNMCFWDFGFSTHANYMINEAGDIKLIDYGGNSFLLTEKNIVVGVKNSRKNLVYSNDKFLTVQFLLHLIYQGLNRKPDQPLASIAQDASLEKLLEIQDKCLNYLKGSVYEEIAQSAVKLNLEKESDWLTLEKTVLEVLESARYGTQESADINNVSFSQTGAIVSGYQSYEIKNSILIPIGSHDNKLWSTDKKFEIVSMAMNIVTSREKIETFLDIGSNLGLYVFNSSLNYKIPQSTGYDYNVEYIKVCQKIQSELGLNGCVFEQKGFSEIDRSFDCVSAMAIIHHLYHRTENWGSLDKLMKKFSEITNKYLIVEFPTEKDPKASRWTKMTGRNVQEAYSLENFLKASSKYFSSYEVVGKIGDTRITYLLKK